MGDNGIARVLYRSLLRCAKKLDKQPALKGLLERDVEAAVELTGPAKQVDGYYAAFLGGTRFYVPAQPSPRLALEAVSRAFRIDVAAKRGDLDAAFYALRLLQAPFKHSDLVDQLTPATDTAARAESTSATPATATSRAPTASEATRVAGVSPAGFPPGALSPPSPPLPSASASSSSPSGKGAASPTGSKKRGGAAAAAVDVRPALSVDTGSALLVAEGSAKPSPGSASPLPAALAQPLPVVRPVVRARGRPPSADARSLPDGPFANQLWRQIRDFWRNDFGKASRRRGPAGGRKGKANALQDAEAEAAAAAAAAAPYAGSGRLQPLVAPRVGALLVAHPRLGGLYEHKVILIVNTNDKAVEGVILNEIDSEWRKVGEMDGAWEMGPPSRRGVTQGASPGAPADAADARALMTFFGARVRKPDATAAPEAHPSADAAALAGGAGPGESTPPEEARLAAGWAEQVVFQEVAQEAVERALEEGRRRNAALAGPPYLSRFDLLEILHQELWDAAEQLEAHQQTGQDPEDAEEDARIAEEAEEQPGSGGGGGGSSAGAGLGAGAADSTGAAGRPFEDRVLLRGGPARSVKFMMHSVPEAGGDLIIAPAAASATGGAAGSARRGGGGSPGLYFWGSMAKAEGLVARGQASADSFRFADGLSVWYGSQLQDEIEEGWWLVAAGSPEWVVGPHAFDLATASAKVTECLWNDDVTVDGTVMQIEDIQRDMWQRALRAMGGEHAALASVPPPEEENPDETAQALKEAFWGSDFVIANDAGDPMDGSVPIVLVRRDRDEDGDDDDGEGDDDGDDDV